MTIPPASSFSSLAAPTPPRAPTLCRPVLTWCQVVGVISFLLSLALAPASAADDTPPPSMPSEVTLTTGRVLRGVSVVRWDRDRVVLRFAGGGGDSIPYSLIAEPLRSRLPAIRAAHEAAAATTKAAAQSEASKPQRYEGQAFIVTRGAANVKLGGMEIVILPIDALKAFETNSEIIRLPKPLDVVTTDAEGRFEFTLPPGTSFVIAAQAQRRVGREWEQYEWRVTSGQIRNVKNILLTNDGLVPRKTWKFD